MAAEPANKPAGRVTYQFGPNPTFRSQIFGPQHGPRRGLGGTGRLVAGQPTDIPDVRRNDDVSATDDDAIASTYSANQPKPEQLQKALRSALRGRALSREDHEKRWRQWQQRQTGEGRRARSEATSVSTMPAGMRRAKDLNHEYPGGVRLPLFGDDVPKPQWTTLADSPWVIGRDSASMSEPSKQTLDFLPSKARGRFEPANPTGTKVAFASESGVLKNIAEIGTAMWGSALEQNNIPPSVSGVSHGSTRGAVKSGCVTNST